MICGRCKKQLRYDERLRTVQTAEGTYPLCPYCVAEHEGGSYSPPTYPPGSLIPRHPQSDADLPICGLCRRALPWGDKCYGMRLREEDVAGTDVEPGAYPACSECRAKWKPGAVGSGELM